jgi:uncharacterized protein YdhG (YjbR/CyaY superfamily)
VTIGAFIGLIGAMAAGKGMGPLLFQVEGHDPTALLASLVLLALFALLAADGPARRASRMDLGLRPRLRLAAMKAPPKPRTTNAYVKALSPEKRSVVEKLRKTIRASAPQAEESFSYGIPGFRLQGKSFLWYAAWEKHYSFYPVTAAMRAVLTAEGEDFETSKGTIRFPADKPLPLAFIRKLVKARLSDSAR